MTALAWDQSGEKRWETGVDHGVLYLRDEDGEYANGYVWNGLTTVTESPSGAESNKTYADNIVYANLKSVEEFGATIEAYTYPQEFARCDGSYEPETGVFIGQQPRETFGFSWRSLIGNDLTPNAGYKLHLVWGCDAAPSEVAHATVNDSPEADTLSWEVTTIPVAVGTIGGVEYRPTSKMTIDSTTADATALAELEAILYGDESVDARLPLPSEVVELFAGTTTVVDLGVAANQPTYNSGTHVVTLPTVTGVQWKINGVNKTPGAQPALTVGQTAEVEAVAQTGYRISGDEDWTFDY